MEGMFGGKRRRVMGVGQDRNPQRLGEADPAFPVSGIAGEPPHQEYRELRRLDAAERLPDRRGGRRRRRRRPVAADIGDGDLLGKRRFLQFGVETDIDRTLGPGGGDLVSPEDGFHRRLGRARLVVPFGVMADHRRLVLGGMNPVDPGPALVGVHRPGGAEDDHRAAPAPGVEDRHGAVHEADIGMQRHGHGRLGDPGIAVGDGDRVFFVQADQHLGIGVAEVIDDGIVKAAIAGAGHQGDIFEVEAPDHFRHHVGTPAHARIAEIGGRIYRRWGGAGAPSSALRGRPSCCHDAVSPFD